MQIAPGIIDREIPYLVDRLDYRGAGTAELFRDNLGEDGSTKTAKGFEPETKVLTYL